MGRPQPRRYGNPRLTWPDIGVNSGRSQAVDPPCAGGPKQPRNSRQPAHDPSRTQRKSTMGRGEDHLPRPSRPPTGPASPRAGPRRPAAGRRRGGCRFRRRCARARGPAGGASDERPLAMVEVEVDDLVRGREALLDDVEQLVEAWPVWSAENEHDARAGRRPAPAWRRALGAGEVDLVPAFDQRRWRVGFVDAELIQHADRRRWPAPPSRCGRCPHMDEEVGLEHLLQRGAEGRDQRGRQVGDEAHRVGEDDPPARGQAD